MQTKIVVPRPRGNIVNRPRLERWLEEGVKTKLTLVSGPAGCGKSTLITGWLARFGQECVWISLDKGDNDLNSFLTCVCTALERMSGAVAAGGLLALNMIRSMRPPPIEFILTALVNELALVPKDVVIVFDDYHHIVTPRVHQAIEFILNHLPSTVHIILATRTTPEFPLARLRASAQMVEVAYDQLRFSEEEVRSFFDRNGKFELSAQNIRLLTDKTEGWAAGLQMVALAMVNRNDREKFIQSLKGTNRYISDFLTEEIFSLQSAEIQEFLLKTSICERLTASLCHSLTGNPNSTRLLSELSDSNLFLSCQDHTGKYFRYQQLFAEFLQGRLESREGGETVAHLHSTASSWFADHNLLAEGVSHALLARDWEKAVSLIHQCKEVLLRHGKTSVMLDWLGAMPEKRVVESPQLCIAFSWALVISGQAAAADFFLDQAEKLLTRGSESKAAFGEIFTIRSLSARNQGKEADALISSEHALNLLPEDKVLERGLATANLGVACWSAGQLSRSERTLALSKEIAVHTGNRHAQIIASSFLGYIKAAHGYLPEAAQIFHHTIEFGGRLPMVSLAYYGLGALYFEWNQLAAAEDYIRQGIEFGQQSGQKTVEISGYRQLARIINFLKGPTEAVLVLEKAHQLAEDSMVSPHFRVQNAAMHVEISLAQGDLKGAGRWGSMVKEEVDSALFFPHVNLTKARLLLAGNQMDKARNRLNSCLQRAQSIGLRYGAVEIRLLQALAMSGKDAPLTVLANLMEFAEQEKLQRTFLNKGRKMAVLLQMAAAEGIAVSYINRLLAAFAQERVVPGGLPVSLPDNELSKREIEILRLMDAGLSNKEIGQRLFVALGTVKTHTANIYKKLGVKKRTAAVARAKHLFIL